MNDFLTVSGIKRVCYVMNGLFLLIHVALFIIFLVYGVMPMAIFNIFSIFFYIFAIYLVEKELFPIYIVIAFVEICVHMFLATVLCGWEVGFHVTLIGICILVFYAEYAGKSLGLKTVNSLILAPFGGLTYLVTFIVSWLNPPIYPLPHGTVFFMQLAWALILFSVAFVILHTFVSVATKSQQELANEMLHDKLTGLPNRYYMSRVFQHISELSDMGGYWLAIADIDSFKQINDTYGHNCGDYVLQTIASLLRSASTEHELCRWGGEEFLVVGGGDTDPEEFLQNVCELVQSHDFRYGGTSIRVTLTAGCTVYSPGLSVTEWIDSADKKLYKGKNAGKNRYVL